MTEFTLQSASLHKYLNRARRGEKRSMTSTEKETARKLWLLQKEMNLCIAEILIVIEVIKRCQEDSFYVTSNLYRTVNSLLRQKDLVFATMKSFEASKPLPYEAKAINSLFTSIRTRLLHLRTVAIPGNVELTPIKEYLDITGRTMREELKDRFPDVKDMFGDGVVEAYADDILRVVEMAGRSDAYKERLEKAKEADRKRRELREMEKAEAEQKKTDELREAAESFLFGFSNRLTYCLGQFIEDRRIGVIHGTLGSALTRKRGKYIVLETWYSDKTRKAYYRYHRGDSVTAAFSGASTYTREEAEKVVKGIIEKDGRKAVMAYLVG